MHIICGVNFGQLSVLSMFDTLLVFSLNYYDVLKGYYVFSLTTYIDVIKPNSYLQLTLRGN